MNAVQQFKKMRALKTDRDLWRQRAIVMAAVAAALAFFILCLGVGQMISGG